MRILFHIWLLSIPISLFSQNMEVPYDHVLSDSELIELLDTENYPQLKEIQIKLNLKEDAFNTLERFRVRSFLNMLAERDLDFSKDAPPELITEQKQTNVTYDRVQQQLFTVKPDQEPEKMEALLTMLRQLREKQNAINAIESVINTEFSLSLKREIKIEYHCEGFDDFYDYFVKSKSDAKWDENKKQDIINKLEKCERSADGNFILDYSASVWLLVKC